VQWIWWRVFQVHALLAFLHRKVDTWAGAATDGKIFELAPRTIRRRVLLPTIRIAFVTQKLLSEFGNFSPNIGGKLQLSWLRPIILASKRRAAHPLSRPVDEQFHPNARRSGVALTAGSRWPNRGQQGNGS